MWINNKTVEFNQAIQLSLRILNSWYLVAAPSHNAQGTGWEALMQMIQAVTRRVLGVRKLS